MTNSISTSSSSENETGSRFKNIPTDLVEEILSRLPTETVLDCKQVCKGWLGIIRCNLSFAKKHLKNHQSLHKYYPSTDDDNKGQNKVPNSNIGFIAHTVEQIEDFPTHRFFYKEYTEKVITTKKFNPSVLSPLAFEQLIGSCDGLICMGDNSIRNPITRECLYLPEFTSEYGSDYWGFGYSVTPTSKSYKAVRVIYNKAVKVDDCLGLVQVYTLGGRSGWRDKQTIPHVFISDPGVFVDGALYWLDIEGHIWAFDLADEKFCSITKLPFDHEEDNMRRHQILIVLGGWLSVVDFYPTRIDVWLFRKTKEDQELRSWTKELSIERDTGSFIPVALTDLGELICSTDHGRLRLYGEGHSIYELEVTHPYDHGIMHVNSFVSLRALGEEDVNVIEEDAVDV